MNKAGRWEKITDATYENCPRDVRKQIDAHIRGILDFHIEQISGRPPSGFKKRVVADLRDRFSRVHFQYVNRPRNWPDFGVLPGRGRIAFIAKMHGVEVKSLLRAANAKHQFRQYRAQPIFLSEMKRFLASTGVLMHPD